MKVHNKKHGTAPADAVYIGRPSKWGNPFVIGKDGNREQVITKFEEWILEQPELLAQLHELKGKDLVCWCAPEVCHGDVLARLANDNKEEKVGNFYIAGTGSRGLIKDKDKRREVRDYLAELLTKAKAKHGDRLIVISGMAEGFDEALARAAIMVDVPFIAAIPNKGYIDYYWGKTSDLGRNRIAEAQEILSKAHEIVYVCDGLYGVGPNGKTEHANFIRNYWMVDHADIVWVYNPTTPGTANCYAYCKKVGKRTFIIDTNNK
jgi:hypothetical protein